MNQQKHIDLDTISREIGIDASVLLELLKIYISEMSQEMLRVKEQHMKQQWSDLEHTIHNIKGVSANLFIQSMYETAVSIDLRLKSMDLKDIDDEIEQLLNVYDTVNKEIQTILELNGSTIEL